MVSNETYSGSISYLYDAQGNKLQKQVTENRQTQTTDYLGAFQYQDGVLDFIPHAEGYVKAVHTGSTTEYHYVYNYTDHLGNIRLSYARDPETDEVAILKESHYYPFGLQHKGYVSTHQVFPDLIEVGKVELLPVRNYLDDSYRYTFGGKEEQLELGLNWIDHHARNYDAALGRWMNVDPLGELAPDWTPYRYGFNNPLRFIDPTGMLEEKKDPPSDDKNVIQLDEVVVKGSKRKQEPKSKRISFNGAMPDHLKHGQPLTWSSPYRQGILGQYNQDNDTDYTEGNQWNQWYYQFFYKREFDEMIADIHSATHTAAELTMYVLPTPIVGLGALSKAPTLYRSAMKSYKISKAFRITNPNALNKTLPGFTDKISGSALREGRAPMIDFLTHKPPLSPTNYHKLNKTSRWLVGGGGSAGALLYYNSKTKKK